MVCHRHNPNCFLAFLSIVLLTLVVADPLCGQQFVTPEVPAGQTMDGQTFGAPSQQSAITGRVIEGRVLTGENGQLGDMTLRFPDSNASDVSGLSSTNGDNTMVFGPIDIEPLTANQPVAVPLQSQQSQRANRQNPPPPRRKRTANIRELPNREIIRQRYPDGNIHIARHVMYDDQGNQVNDGQWKLFDQQGAMIASGTYRNGAMDGKWSRLHTAGSGGIFSNEPFIEFDGPYASHATFDAGKLSGSWVIEDRRGQKIFEMPYKDGRRNGVAVWHLPQGKIYRRMEFQDDVPVGNLVEYDKQGKIRRKEIYKNGMKIVNNVTYYRPSGQKRQESIVQRGRLELEGEDDWWEAKPAPMVVTGQDVQNGPIRSWYENGQTKMVGNLADDVRVGEFVWWHRNGTKQLVGQYNKSGEKVGRWRWWHDNGIKSIDGGYTQGQPDGPWKWWNEEGQLVNEEDFDPDAEATDDDLSFSINSLQDSSEQTTDDANETQLGTADDAFGEDPEDLLEEGSLNDDSENSPQDSVEPRLENTTEELEGIEPEAFDTEEIPEPDTTRRMPASLRSTEPDSSDIEAFFQIQDND